MLQNAYFLAKIGADTAENEQHFAEILPIDGWCYSGCRCRAAHRRASSRAGRRGSPEWQWLRSSASASSSRRHSWRWSPVERGLAKLANFCKFLAGSFSAVSKRNFARKYAFDSICQALQDLHTFAPLQTQNFSKKNRFEKSAIFVKIQQYLCRCCKTCKVCQISKMSAR